MEKIEFECLLEGVTTMACDQMIEVLQKLKKQVTNTQTDKKGIAIRMNVTKGLFGPDNHAITFRIENNHQINVISCYIPEDKIKITQSEITYIG